mmetsp:Transcript_16958/g.23992  ORF Transcript_16958/g.23992 Transcript_16958/m.23992 type:complete len:237 (+) Transcript_16958:357-1067(+)
MLKKQLLLRLAQRYEYYEDAEHAIPNVAKTEHFQMAKNLKNKPPITEMISINRDNDTATITSDISSLLDFAIIGFAKAATSTLLQDLSPYTSTPREEVCNMVVGDIPILVNDLYTLSNEVDGKRLPRGIKCPQDISSDASIQNFATYFPRTKLIIGIRHPLYLFESLYNFRILQGYKVLPTNKLTNRCIPGSQGVCAWRTNIADFLARMGKTPMIDEEKKIHELETDAPRRQLHRG